MYERFKIDADKLKGFLNMQFGGQTIFMPNYADGWKDYYDNLLKMTEGNNGVIDGGVLRNYVFPIDKDYDVFISYSHNDRHTARKLAFFLENTCGLKVFLDEFVWGSADKLIAAIDEKYCFNEEKTSFVYRRRNLSTSYIHALLSMSILDVISRSECCIFIESDNSLCLKDIKENTSTFSPWIYEEINYMNHLPKQSLRRTRYFTNSRELDEGLNFEIMLPVDVNGFHVLTKQALNYLRIYKGTRGLDYIYKLYERANI